MKFVYYSQIGQDKWVIKNIFNYKKCGYFIEAAALDGITNSNTYTLEKYLNWTGLLIEPNLDMYNKLIKNRTSTCINAALVNKNHKIKFRCDRKTPGHSNVIPMKRQHKNSVIINGYSLEHLLKKYNAPKIIDYFSLDVEGGEELILTTFNFKRYTFLAMTIENSTRAINNILFKNGYVLIKEFEQDIFCCHKSIIGSIRGDI